MKLNFSKIFLYCYSLLLLFTPLLVFHKTSELFEFNKMLFIYFMTTVVIFIWIAKMVIHKKIIIKKTFLDLPIFLFFISQLLSTLFSIDRHTSILGYYGRFNGGLLSLTAYIVLYYGLVSNLTFSIKLEQLLKISLASSLIVVLIGLTSKFGFDVLCLLFTGLWTNGCWTDQFQPAVRMFSTLGQPNWLGAYLAIHFFIGLYFLLRSGKAHRRSSLLYTLYLLLNVTAILFTRSRSTFFAVAAGFIFFTVLIWLLSKEFKKALIKKIVIVSCLLLVLIIIVKTGTDFFQPVKSKNLSPALSSLHVTDSFEIRKIVWRGALALGLKYPLLGTGVETFAYSYYFTRPLTHNLTSEWDFIYNKAHNEYLNYFATTGFLGLGAYLFFILSFVWYTIKQVKSQKSILRSNILSLSLLAAWITILITNFFGFSTTTINLFFFLIPALTMAFSSKNHLPEEKSVRLTLRQKLFVLTDWLVFVATVMLIIAYFAADLYFARASDLARANDYEQSINLLDKSLRLHREHVYEDKLATFLATVAYLSSYQKENDDTQKLINLADSYNTKSLRSSPHNVLYWKTRAKNQFLFYQVTFDKKYFNQAAVSLNKASQLAPTDPKTPYMASLFYSYAFDGEKDKSKQVEYQQSSIEAIDQAIKLKRDYRDGYLLKGQLLKKYGRQQEAKAVFEYILKIDPNDKEIKQEIKNL